MPLTYNGFSPTRVQCARIVCTNGTVIRFAMYPRNLKMSNGSVYLAGSGYEVTAYSAASGTSPSMVDLRGIVDAAGVSKNSILSGLFDNARCYHFYTTWDDPIEDEQPITLTFLGKFVVSDNIFTVEQMSLSDVLNQVVGKIYSPQCDKVFGSMGFAGCKKTPVVVTGTITQVYNYDYPYIYTIQDNTRTEVLDFFSNGTIRFLTGANAGLPAKHIKTYNYYPYNSNYVVAGNKAEVNGLIVVTEPFWNLPVVGDQYEMTEGCLKTHQACKAKGNILNCGCFPHLPPSSVFADRGVKQ